MSSVFRVKFESAFPTFTSTGTPGRFVGKRGSTKGMKIGWRDDSLVVKIEGNDSQVAVDMVRDRVLEMDKTCSPDAPVNAVKGFRLREVEFITRIDIE